MYFLFDIGGTNMRFAVGDGNKLVSELIKVPTPQEYRLGLYHIEEVYNQLRENYEITSAAGGIAGPFDQAREKLLSAPHLKEWEGKNIAQDFHRIFKVPVMLENDAALVGLGEATFGAGRGFSIVMYITVSTGIGGARIVNGKIDAVKYGFEPGHQIVNMTLNEDDIKSFFAKANPMGSLEGYVSGSAVIDNFKMTPPELDNDEYWEFATRTLAVGLYNSILHWSPDVIVLGGGITISGRINIEKLEKYLGNLSQLFPAPEIKIAELGDKSGLLGAMEFVHKK